APAYGAHLTQRLQRALFAPVAHAGHYPAVEQPDATAEAIEAFAQENAR
ncbi:MAG: alpha/beta hydrolase, partial [Alphaproteobacteria bacterium]|nr:alpha/beta hydrolase [Alphaproteobacteria bacterium]